MRFLELEASAESTPTIRARARSVTLLRTGTTEGRYVSQLPVVVSRELPIDATLSVASEVLAGEKLTVDLKTVLRGGSSKSDYKVGFTGLPAGMEAPATTIKPGAETPQIVIPVPPKTLPGRYSLAVTVTGTVLPEVSEGDAKPDEQQVTVWSNAVSFQVLPSATPEKPADK